MKYKVFKRVTRKYEEKFSKEKQTEEIHIKVNGVEIHIAEQQCGYPLDEPHVTIFVPKEYGCYDGVDSYSMSFETFIKEATKLKYRELNYDYSRFD